jgi:murein DD-endopeptidase MepM/ murein hydrolase activator NlpD
MPCARTWVSIIVSIILTPVVSFPQGAEPAALKITHSERALAPGEIVLLRVEGQKPLTQMGVRAFAREFPMFPENEGRSWVALVGIDMDAVAGTYPVEIRGSEKGGIPVGGEIRLAVAAKRFPTRALTVDPKFVTPPALVLARIRQEAERVRAIFDSTSPEKYWGGEFLVPVPGPVISEFGKRSIYNGQPRSAHSGTDFRGATGTPIRAPNGGKVVLAANLYYSGNTVILDHGLGLFSYFGHMSEFLVKEGDRIERGIALGKVGATGLVTGPHLHWTLRLAGTRVDPMSLLSLLGSPEQRN